MNKKFALSFFLFNIFVNSQIFMVMDEEKMTIPNVKAINENGEIVGISDLNGKLNIAEHPSNNLELFHADYQISFINSKLNNDTIILKKFKTKDIDEVVISNQSKKYLNLYAYFISYQLINNTPQSYSDGIIVYTINTKTQKIRKTKIIKQRLLKNVDFLNRFYKENPNRTLSVGSNIYPFSFYEELLNSNNVKIENDKIQIKEKDYTITNENNLTINIVYNSPLKTKKQSILGLKSEVTDHYITESFKSTNFKLKDLKSIAKYYTSKISQKGFSYKYELVQNIYIVRPEFSDAEETSLITMDDYQNLIPENIQSLINKNILK
ncbi:hypothetical protein Q73A0000_05475 [Kaistella flava (ex Peng et al. 2021)]|uniref:Uncharacterized protein n=1 Tax=Kaistella flava (ex Peng et al. 2021) TaxID=2038776 RepID=A0A7M2Y6Y5_9FLAO|nr:hypothetical protein [Kaistella flava (ex Peng et al. 2021)]QOW09850.1 hypothetical protein Q73A0000_05475 [Kaistella flava (ex Peng et al. 2021)]